MIFIGGGVVSRRGGGVSTELIAKERQNFTL